MEKFFELVKRGDSTLQKRYEMFVSQKISVEKQIEELKKSLEVIDFKVNYYKAAVAAGTEKFLFGEEKLPYSEEFLNKK